ncbi:hypothetical protein V6N11_048313 [Hibiscus sabdariffa]|uniref:Uncharacterized protein n=1 Tax=Hibiscus sabdariffa TaxID=183260 RepID=A0ABR2PVC6_9ROSI
MGAGVSLKHSFTMFLLEFFMFFRLKETGVLALNRTLAKPCLSDIEQVLTGQGAGTISDAATRLALKASGHVSMDGPHVLPQHSTRVNDCKTIVLRWLATLRISPSRLVFLLDEQTEAIDLNWSLHRICCGSSPRCIFDGYSDALTILVRG